MAVKVSWHCSDFNALYQKHTLISRLSRVHVCMYVLLAILPAFTKCQISRISFLFSFFFFVLLKLNSLLKSSDTCGNTNRHLSSIKIILKNKTWKYFPFVLIFIGIFYSLYLVNQCVIFKYFLLFSYHIILTLRLTLITF